VKKSLVVFVVLAVLAAVTVGVVVMRGRRPNATEPIASGALRGANVLLVTVDTLRADHVGAYGSTRGATPTIDRLAAEGWRVETAYAHVPLTLPSHTALLTGAYPFVNGVRDNGSFRFDGRQPTLASTLKAAGYRTGAFVAAFVLDARFGLNAGFDVYDDKYGSRPTGGGVSVLERPADQVLNAAVTGHGSPGRTSTIRTNRTIHQSRSIPSTRRTRTQARSRSRTHSSVRHSIGWRDKDS
jgi:arylsulfatase A-like enzyme